MTWKWMAGTAALLAGSLLLASAPGTAAELTLEPGSAAGGETALAIGDHLWVGAAGLAPGSAADLRLRDPEGRVVTAARVRAGDRGEVPPEVLWQQTGIAGCDCGEDTAAGGAHTFRTFEEAELALIGTQWTVELVDGGGKLLASRMLRLERTQELQVYFSDASGCPRRRLAPDEDVYMSFRGPEVPRSSRVFLVADRPTWEDPLPLVEVRPEAGPGGEVIEGLSSPLFTALVWPGDPTGGRTGYFAAVVRTDVKDETLDLLPTDRVRSHNAHGDWRSFEAGIVIREWGCGIVRN